MLALNLLSPEQKIDSNLQWNYLIIRNVILMILVVSFVMSFVLFSAKVVLLTKLQEAEAETALVDASQIGTNNSITNLNQQIQFTKTAQKDFTPWSVLMWHFFQTIPGGIALTDISINTGDAAINLSGIANSRDDLLNFKTELETTEYIEEIYLPLNSLLQKTDIKFTINIKLDLKKIQLYE